MRKELLGASTYASSVSASCCCKGQTACVLCVWAILTACYSAVFQVDATQEADLGTKYGVNGYPTIKWFIDGEVAMDYGGGRDA